jgi:hypothetical protein
MVLLLITLLALTAAALSNQLGGEQTTDSTSPASTPSTIATTAAPTTTLPPTTTLAPTTTVSPTTTTTIATVQSVAGEIGVLLASLEEADSRGPELRQVEDRVEKALEEWQSDDRDKLRRELEGAFEEAAKLDDSPQRTELMELLTQMAELMGFRVDSVGGGEGNGDRDGDGDDDG